MSTILELSHILTTKGMKKNSALGHPRPQSFLPLRYGYTQDWPMLKTSNLYRGSPK